jgi:hypothetical protein
MRRRRWFMILRGDVFGVHRARISLIARGAGTAFRLMAGIEGHSPRDASPAESPASIAPTPRWRKGRGIGA